MLSRSHLLVENELAGIYKSKPWGIQVSIINDNIYEWSARIDGPPGTYWEGGVFRIYLKFDEHYNSEAPRVCFHTIPYHPNIDMITGRPCIDYLDDCTKWSPNIKIMSILLQIQSMLGNPVLDEPINVEAANMLRNSPQTYKKIVEECVEYSKQIDGGQVDRSNGRQHSLQREPEMEPTEVPKSGKAKKITKLSFDDYFAQWNGIATTKPASASVNPYLETIKDDSMLRKIHFGMSEEELLEEDFDKQMEYDHIYYGAVHQRPAVGKDKIGSDSKLARINQMRKIYLPKKPLPTPRSPTRHSDSDGEVDNLVAWTQKLDPDEVGHL